jgi:MFS family permease
VFVVRWVETVAVGVFVYQDTGSAFTVAMMTMLRLLPMGLFGAFLGAIAERTERRTTLILVTASMVITSLTLAILAHWHLLEVWHLAVASFINGIGWATDNPVRRVMIGEAVGAGQMGTAMSVDVACLEPNSEHDHDPPRLWGRPAPTPWGRTPSASPVLWPLP